MLIAVAMFDGMYTIQNACTYLSIIQSCIWQSFLWIDCHSAVHTHTYYGGTSCTSTEKALSEARESLEEIRKEMQAWRTQHEATHRKLKTEQAANSTIRVYAHCMSYTALITVGHPH